MPNDTIPLDIIVQANEALTAFQGAKPETIFKLRAEYAYVTSIFNVHVRAVLKQHSVDITAPVPPTSG